MRNIRKTDQIGRDADSSFPVPKNAEFQKVNRGRDRYRNELRILIDPDTDPENKIIVSTLFGHAASCVGLVVHPKAPHMPGIIVAAKSDNQVPPINRH